MRRALIMAGGTGGHVFPALAVAEALAEQGVTLHWLGTRRGIEARLVPQKDIAIDYLTVEGVRGRGLKGLLKAPFLLMLALVQALGVLRREKPDVVIGFGGFASGPGGVAAWLSRVPLVLHEQNAVAGTTNRLLSRLARAIATGFDGVFERGEWVGNPVRRAISDLPAPAERFAAREGQSLNLLVLGGSLGARALNELVPQALAGSGDWNVWHQCGERHVQAASAHYAQARVKARVVPFIEDMAEAYGWADLVICRAGALTVAELMAAGVGAVLVPLPHAIDDHQTRNAAVLAGAGAGLSLPQAELTPASLGRLLRERLNSREALLEMADSARRLHRPDAAGRVVRLCEECTNG